MAHGNMRAAFPAVGNTLWTGMPSTAVGDETVDDADQRERSVHPIAAAAPAVNS
jgi:hypothetical protein